MACTRGPAAERRRQDRPHREYATATPFTYGKGVTSGDVAEGRIDKTVPVVFSTDDTFDVGADWGPPVSPTYEPPFEFTGTLDQVTIEVT